MKCKTFRKESDVTEEVTSSSVEAEVQPEHSKTSPSAFQRAISKHNDILRLTMSNWPFQMTCFARQIKVDQKW